MQKRVRVRRERPSTLSWAFALMLTMLAVYVITLNPASQEPAQQAAARQERVTKELTLQGMTVHFADLGVYAGHTEANIAAAGFSGRGAAGVVRADADGYHVLGMGYGLEADARRIAQRISEQEGISADVLTLSAPSVALRVTAPAADIEAISTADAAVRTCLNRISALALQADRGEVGASSARTLAALARSELTQAVQPLQEVPGASEEALCMGLIALADGLCTQLHAVASGNASGAALTSALRCCHADGCIRLIQWLDAIAAG